MNKSSTADCRGTAPFSVCICCQEIVSSQYKIKEKNQMFVSEQNPIGQLPASQDKLLCHTNSSPPATATGNSCCWICLGMLICWYLNLFRCIQYAGPNWDRQMPQVWHPSFTDAKTCGKESEDVPGIYLNSWRPCFDKKYDGAVLVAFWIHSSCWPSKMKSISSTRKVVLKLVQLQVRVWLSGEIQLVSGALGQQYLVFVLHACF